jgi:N-acetyl-anhydromuramyl-L-alanine amidase AmpD
MIQKPKIIPAPAANYYSSNYPVKSVVNHGTALKPDAVSSLAYLTSKASNVSANYLIEKDGTIYELLNPLAGLRSWANGIIENPDPGLDWLELCIKNGINPNLVTVSIEHEAYDTDMRYGVKMPPAQAQASVMLNAWLCQEYGIKDLDQGVIGHNQITGIQRAGCPGGIIDLPEHRKKIQAVLDMDQAVINSNGFNIVLGFKDRYLAIGAVINPADPAAGGLVFFGLALTNEYQYQGETVQVFERYVMTYNPANSDLWKISGKLAGAEWLKNNPAP